MPSPSATPPQRPSSPASSPWWASVGNTLLHSLFAMLTHQANAKIVSTVAHISDPTLQAGALIALKAGSTLLDSQVSHVASYAEHHAPGLDLAGVVQSVAQSLDPMPSPASDTMANTPDTGVNVNAPSQDDSTPIPSPSPIPDQDHLRPLP